MTKALQDARRRAELIARGARRKLGAVSAATPAGIKNLGYAMGLQRDDFSERGGRAPNVQPGEFLNIAALKLVQPVDVVLELE